mmetsp:Transcript_54292/g.113432  ORF Transcript_54292/g.113432 Transcript_54292/m.113432 type:complete len:111 (-) Transcript_54292:432-764(-)
MPPCLDNKTGRPIDTRNLQESVKLENKAAKSTFQTIVIPQPWNCQYLRRQERWLPLFLIQIFQSPFTPIVAGARLTILDLERRQRNAERSTILRWAIEHTAMAATPTCTL